MDPRLQRRVQRYGWDKAANLYESYWSRQLAPAQARVLALAALRPGERVIDIACGTGLVTFPAAEAVGPTGHVLATDISDAMVETVRAERAALGFGWIEVSRMDAEALSSADATFDAAICALGLMYVPFPVKALAEMRRVLRPGGRAVAGVWGRRDRCGWAEIFPIVERRVVSDVCPMFFQLGTGDSLSRAFADAGFVEISAERLATTLVYESDTQAIGAAFAGGPVALAYSHFDEATRESAHAEYRASIEPHRRGTGYEIPGEFVIVAGRVA